MQERPSLVILSKLSKKDFTIWKGDYLNPETSGAY